jgi:hypothetical protein
MSKNMEGSNRILNLRVLNRINKVLFGDMLDKY